MRKLLTVLIIAAFCPLAFSKTVSYAQRLCNTPDYTCIVAKKGDTWEKLFPDREQRDVIKRINRLNIPVYTGMPIAIPNTFNPDIMAYSPFEQNIGPQQKKKILVDPVKLAWAAYDEEGNLLRWGPAALGKPYCADIKKPCKTVQGTFTIYRKGNATCKSSKYPVGKGGGPMPYCMFFEGGYAVHGSYHLPGHHASYGCVRIYPEDAQWLNEEFIDLPKQGGTHVEVKSYEA